MPSPCCLNTKLQAQACHEFLPGSSACAMSRIASLARGRGQCLKQGHTLRATARPVPAVARAGHSQVRSVIRNPHRSVGQVPGPRKLPGTDTHRPPAATGVISLHCTCYEPTQRLWRQAGPAKVASNEQARPPWHWPLLPHLLNQGRCSASHSNFHQGDAGPQAGALRGVARGEQAWQRPALPGRTRKQRALPERASRHSALPLRRTGPG